MLEQAARIASIAEGQAARVASIAEGQAARVAAIVEEVLGDALIGVYLHGSAVDGGLRPFSDIDVLALTHRSSTREERLAIIGRLLAISGHHAVDGPARSVELSVVVQGHVRPWRYPPELDLQYGDWWRAELERGEEPWVSPNPDLAIVLSATLASARPMRGPAITAVLDPVPPSDLRRALLDAIPALLGDLQGDEANVVLTLTRMWLTMVTGAIRPKDVAADWALERLPREHREVVGRARAVYLGEASDDWAGLEVSACAGYLRTQVELAGRPAG